MAVKANQSKGPLDHGKSHLCYVLSVSGLFIFFFVTETEILNTGNFSLLHIFFECE